MYLSAKDFFLPTNGFLQAGHLSSPFRFIVAWQKLHKKAQQALHSKAPLGLTIFVQTQVSPSDKLVKARDLLVLFGWGSNTCSPDLFILMNEIKDDPRCSLIHSRMWNWLIRELLEDYWLRLPAASCFFNSVLASACHMSAGLLPEQVTGCSCKRQLLPLTSLSSCPSAAAEQDAGVVWKSLSI